MLNGLNIGGLVLLTDPDVVKGTVETEIDDPNRLYPLVNLTIPKFKVSKKTDLLPILRELGISDALDPELSDYTPLTKDRDDIYLAKADHAAMIEIDEHGVTGAAYTEIAIAEGVFEPGETVEYTVDRPFAFTVVHADSSILFSGIVTHPEK